MTDELREGRPEWGVMFHDGSVHHSFNGRTAHRRAADMAERLARELAPDNIRLVTRRTFVTDWREVEG
ncbi:hypothetical protein GCM10027053_51860 [Intrasporangium mesophilum]